MGNPDPPVPISIETLLEVVDLNQQTLKSTTSLVLHPSKYYVGIQLENNNIATISNFTADFVVADIGMEFSKKFFCKLFFRWKTDT